ncbi:tetratricopeptide repeat protein [Glycomyces buryatensis]|uniref:Tetratricopeptide repeat protein n=1 Tax=Glycomyces buryatensis TaxID=2570927 RepID=A0A4S8QGU8_9ACTN|nr:tetratricopeptide repeat protein [Glycomyces buryatensis]THV42195.1 tetratricopeptide repeat protein [Glycomyces buryatensis]
MRNGEGQGRVLKAVAKTWPGVVMGAVQGRAREHIDAGRFDEAADTLAAAAERYGAESAPALLLAWTLYKAGRSEDALEWAGVAAEREPDNPDVYWLQSNTLYDLERPDEAAEVMWKAVELSPDSGSYYIELAWFQYQDREYARTVELVEKALELAPDDAQVHYTAGLIFDHHLRHKRAQEHYERALEIDPENTDARYDLAEVFQTRGRLSQGVRCVWETVPGEETETDHGSMYEVVLRRWSWRWYEWALRGALVLNVIDWIVPTPMWLGAVLAGVLIGGFGVQYARSVAALPGECRRDLVGQGRRGFFVGAIVRTVLALAAIAAVLMMELPPLQHLAVLALIIGGYADWYRGAVRISQNVD